MITQQSADMYSTYPNRGIATANEIYCSVFIGNKALYGGALADTKQQFITLYF